MREKPFWEGKTCEEMAGLPVKAVFKNGVTITGQLSRFGGRTRGAAVRGEKPLRVKDQFT